MATQRYCRLIAPEHRERSSMATALVLVVALACVVVLDIVTNLLFVRNLVNGELWFVLMNGLVDSTNTIL